MKNILILKGSPREKGNSSVLAGEAARGAQQAGAHVEQVDLHALDIRPCDACDECAERKACIIEDDMQPLYPKLAAANAILLASPVYWFTYSAQMKLCIDRWYAFQASNWQEVSHKQFGIILTYGDTDLESSGGINAVKTYETMVRFLRGSIVGMVHGSLSSVGDAEKNPDLMKQAFELGIRLASGS